MFRMTTLKMSLLSALATLFLLVAMLASSGTASAHTASCQPQQVHTPCPIPGSHPHLAVYDVMTINGSCKEMFVQGTGFTPGPVQLVASGYKYPLTLSPNGVPANANGTYSQDLIMCSDGFGAYAGTVSLVAIDSQGHKSNKVLV
jgi:hypothetical protein